VLLLLPFVPGVGFANLGAQIWARIGPITFQPGELAKLALLLFFAGYLTENRELLSVSTFRLGPLMLPDPKRLGPLLLALGVALFIFVAQNDLGPSLLLFTLFLVLIWVTTERLSYLVLGAGLFVVGAYVAVHPVRSRGPAHRGVARPVAPRGHPQRRLPDRAGHLRPRPGRTHRHRPGLGNPERVPVVTTDFDLRRHR
jgi:cell division protein FtsW (lipid II flippase)